VLERARLLILSAQGSQGVYSKESLLGFVAEDLDGSEDLKYFMEMLSPTEEKELQLPVITGTGTLNDKLRLLVD
jgi:hypothetical protein